MQCDSGQRCNLLHFDGLIDQSQNHNNEPDVLPYEIPEDSPFSLSYNPAKIQLQKNALINKSTHQTQNSLAKTARS